MSLHRHNYAVSGFLLGLGAPLGAVCLHALMNPPFNLAWLSHELRHHFFFYAYMGVSTPAVFALFGVFSGGLLDKFYKQKQTLEEVNVFLKEQSIIDELTGFYNRRHILQEIEKEIERARRYKHTLVGIMIDIDDFKKYNDKYGHLLGDYVLKESAKVFDHSIRTIDILGRYGGDEFLIVLPEATLETGHVVAERIKKTMAKHEFKVKNRAIKVTVSMGVHFFDDLTDTDKNLFIETIDKALFQAKTQGKNRAFSQDASANANPPKTKNKVWGRMTP